MTSAVAIKLLAVLLTAALGRGSADGAVALLVAQRYGVLEAEATAAIVASTVAFVATAGLWLAILSLT